MAQIIFHCNTVSVFLLPRIQSLDTAFFLSLFSHLLKGWIDSASQEGWTMEHCMKVTGNIKSQILGLMPRYSYAGVGFKNLYFNSVPCSFHVHQSFRSNGLNIGHSE